VKQFILRCEPSEDGTVQLTGEEFHYLANVRRVRSGDILDCRLPSGAPAVLLIKYVEKKALIAECTLKSKSSENCPKSVFPAIILFQSMVKGMKMDLIVRQAGEAGVTDIAPFYSGRSTPRHTADSVVDSDTERCRRWRRILIEARQQSGSSIATSVRPPMKSDELFNYWEQLKNQYEKSLALLVHEIPLAKSGFHKYLDKVPELIVLAVGPEGGFSQAEADDFMDAGFKPVTLGDTILRAESAALYSVAVVRTLIFERCMWTTVNL
jgi:16S rRNA (uracil1498-N3)-methyltransferase